MGWIALAVVVAIAVFSPGFRILLGALLVLALIVGGGFYLWSSAQESKSRSLVPVADVGLENIRLGSGSYSYQLTGRIRNRNTRYTLKTFTLRIGLQDCVVVEKEKCDAIGQSEKTVYVTVPPGQVRDISDSVYFSPDPKITGQMQWMYHLTGVTAE